jgi:predicted PurR-regulated permease PerM
MAYPNQPSGSSDPPRITNPYRSSNTPLPSGRNAEAAWVALLQAPITRALLIVAGAVLGVLLLGSWASAAAGSLLMVLLASILALALNPLVVWLELRHVPRGLGAVLVVLAVIGLIGGVLAIVAPMLYSQGERFAANAPTMLSSLRDSLPWLERVPGVNDVLNGKVTIASIFGAGSGALLSGVSVAASSAIGVLTSLFLMVTMVVFLLSNPQPVVRGVLNTIPANVRPPLERLLSRLGRQLSLWLVSALTVSTILGTFLAIGLAFAGFQDAFLFGAIYAVCNLVPVVGPLVGMLPAILFAAADANWGGVGWAVVIPLVLQQLDGYFLSPTIFRRTTQLHPLSVLVSVSVFGSLMGFVGTFLAVPMVIIVKAIVEEIYLPHTHNTEVTEENIAAVLNVPPPDEVLEADAMGGLEGTTVTPSGTNPVDPEARTVSENVSVTPVIALAQSAISLEPTAPRVTSGSLSQSQAKG